MVQIVAFAYGSGFCTPSFASVEDEDSICVQGIGRRYSQKAVAATFNFGSPHGILDSVTVSAEPSAEEFCLLWENVYLCASEQRI